MDQTRPPEASAPLSPGQEVLWASQRRHADAPLYNMAFSVEIDGAIDPDRFREAFGRLVLECDALRTVLEEQDGIGAQRVLADAGAEMVVIDLSDQPDPSGAFRAAASERCATPMRLDERTYDAALYRLDDARWGWYLCQHHVVSDAWSAAVLFRRLGSLYEAIATGADPGPAPPPARSIATPAPDEAAHAHWARARGREATDVPYGLSDSTTTSNTRVTVPTGAERTAALRELAMRPGIRALTPDLTMFRLLTTGMVAFLRRVCGTRSLVLGAPGHNRITAPARQAVGLFTEVFPMVFEGDETDTFESLYTRVVDETDLFLRHARPDAGDAGAGRSISTVLNMIRAAFGPFAGMPTTTVWEHSGHVEPEHWLRMHVADFDGTGELTLLFDCNDGVFNSEARVALVAHCLATLDAMVESWSSSVETIDLLRGEPARLERSEPESSVDVVEAFEAHATETPQAEAVIDGDQTLTYEQLRSRARALADVLPAGARIGVCFGRSADAIIAMLGTLMADAAFVPLDASWPTDRLRYVVEDAGCRAVLTDASLSLDVPVTDLDGAIGGALASVQQVTDACGLAYVLYTSGSTGRPKGVMIERPALACYAGWASAFYDRGERLTFPLFTQLTFDLTLTSIFVPLVSGGRIVVFPEASGDADLAVQAVFDDPRIDIVKLTPSHLALVEEPRVGRIRQLILGGEGLLTPVAERATAQLGEALRIHNEYGPTEATVGCIVHTYEPNSDLDASVPIGRPVAGACAVILDDAGNPVPDGVAGELWLGGPGLARGYAGREDLTAERFRTIERAGGLRLYQTGDLARRRADGVFEYLGRTDDQVKLRGARIELGEVESAIASHPGISGAAAMIRTRRVAPPVRSERTCRRCGLPASYPGTTYDASGLCNQCRAFDGYAEKARVYFKPMSELEAVFASATREPAGTHDCIVLFSGGKDSSYMLARLADMGLRILAFTLDNGFISDQAKSNIARVVEALGVDHVWGSTPAMNEIFVDSLQRHANVCHGCFKTIYTLSTEIARKQGIPCIVTGLSRGQFFETRLTPDLFTELTVSVEGIDEKVLAARKAYHRVDDAVSRCMDVSMFEDESIFEQVRFVDFYRYCDVELDELYEYLDRRLPWVRPTDTGRSTNCLINDAGIYVHRHVRGFHNYALPYSWDVRMGHKKREAALDELDDEIDETAVQAILREIGYPEDVASIRSASRLVGYYVADQDLSRTELREHVAARLPASMIPAQFVRVERIPLSANGKVDRGALPEPEVQTRPLDAAFVPATTEVERTLATIWQEVLGLDAVSVDDRFFDLGGDSIMAIQVVARASRRGIRISLAQVFEEMTVGRLAMIASVGADSVETRAGPIRMLPAQAWALDVYGDGARALNHVVTLRVRGGATRERIAGAFDAITRSHDAFRWVLRDGQALLRDPEDGPCWCWSDDRGPFDLGTGPLLRISMTQDGPDALLTCCASHMIVDAVSWGVLCDDLDHLLSSSDAMLPAVVTSSSAWADHLVDSIGADEADRWSGLTIDAPAPAISSGTLRTEQARLDEATTSRLLDGTAAWRIGIDELLLSALADVAADPTRRAGVLVERHGRESASSDVDATRTIGWLTSLFPLVLNLPPAGDLAGVMRQTRDAVRAVTRGGVGYGILRYMQEDPGEQVSVRHDTMVLFNYLGRLPGAGQPSGRIEQAGPIELVRAPGATTAYRAELNAMLEGDSLVIDLSFDDARLSPTDGAAMLARVVQTLHAMADACEAGAMQDQSAGDFPMANLDAAGLNALAGLLKPKGKNPS